MSKRPRPTAIYRKPDAVQATPEALREWAQRMTEPDPLGRMLAEWGDALRELLEREGVTVEKRAPGLRRGITVTSVDGGFACYRRADASPVALEAIDALAAIEDIRRWSGDRRVLAAVDFGQALERLRATAAFARAIHAGAGTMRGGRKGAARAHGPHAEREAAREQWRARYAELRRKFPTDPKKTLLGMIGDETGETIRTLRRYIKQR